jgi:hypothetical protein
MQAGELSGIAATTCAGDDDALAVDFGHVLRDEAESGDDVVPDVVRARWRKLPEVDADEAKAER